MPTHVTKSHDRATLTGAGEAARAPLPAQPLEVPSASQRRAVFRASVRPAAEPRAAVVQRVIASADSAFVSDRVTGRFESYAQAEAAEKAWMARRLARAREREERRAGRGAPLRSRADLYARAELTPTAREETTPFGNVKTKKGRADQPYLWTKPAVDSRYMSLATDLDDVPKQRESILGGMEDYLSGTGRVTAVAKPAEVPDEYWRSAAALSGLLSMVEPHRSRNPLGGKLERAAVRHARRKQGFTETFGGADPAYIPAAEGGTKKLKDVIDDPQEMSAGTLDLLGDMSSSSDDEEACHHAIYRRGRKIVSGVSSSLTSGLHWLGRLSGLTRGGESNAAASPLDGEAPRPTRRRPTREEAALDVLSVPLLPEPEPAGPRRSHRLRTHDNPLEED